MIEVKNTVKCCGDSKNGPPIYIDSDSFDNRVVHVDICGNEVQVLGSDLITAIENAMNTNYFGN